MVYLGLWKGLSKEESLEFGFEPRDRRVWQAANSKQMDPWNRKILNYALEFSKAYRLSTGQVWYTCTECKRGVYCRSDGMLNLLSYTHIRILQAASAAHLTAVLTLYDLAYVSSEQAAQHCCQPSATNLSVPQADWPRLSCRNQGGWLPKQRQVLQKCFLKDTIRWTQGIFI